MRVFVAGATGVLGKRAVAQLVAAGHDVTGVARSPEKAALLRGLGATPVTVDLFDAGAVRAAVAGHEVVCNLATNIPPLTKAAIPSAWATNERIRTDASRNLVDAAIAAGARRYIQESITFPYVDRGAEWIDETVEVDQSPATRATAASEANAQRFTDSGGTGVVLRFGFFYGPDSAHTQTFVKTALAGIAPGIGDRDGFTSSIQLDDAAAAVVAALDAPAGVYNVVEDEPVTRRDYARVLARALGRRRALAPPKVLAKAGPDAALLSRSQRVSNRRFREATGWAPRYPSVREGWPVVVAEMDVPDPLLWPRVALALVTVSALMVGVWAAFAPLSFYDSFPGAGRQWVAVDGPYNEHLVRDVGSLYLGLSAVAVAAVVLGGRTLLRAAAVALLVSGAPHLVYHLRHLDVYDTSDQIGNVVSLGLGVLLPVAVLVGCRRRDRATPLLDRGGSAHLPAAVAGAGRAHP